MKRMLVVLLAIGLVNALILGGCVPPTPEPRPIVPSPSPTPQPADAPRPTPVSSPAPLPSTFFEIINAPAEVNIGDSFTVTVKSNYHLFQKPQTNTYSLAIVQGPEHLSFGSQYDRYAVADSMNEVKWLVKINSQFIPAKEGPALMQFYVITDWKKDSSGERITPSLIYEKGFFFKKKK